MQIKGEYEVDILIQNMFHSYNIITKNHNIVTNEGLNFILQILAQKTDKQLGEVYVGTNTTEASSLDNKESFSSSAIKIPSTDRTVENNKLTYIIKTSGDKINGTSEIGIWSSDDNIVITRDVHDRYDVPDSAIITIKYSLTLTNKETIEAEEEENNND